MIAIQAMDNQQPDARREQRTNMFVMATISSGSACGPVKIRNMSPSGALIEGAALPAQGEAVHLARGSITVRGKIAWTAAGKAGVSFEGRVEVADWTPGAQGRQKQVDRLVQQYKAGAIPTEADDQTPSDGLSALDLSRLARSIDALADAMADDPVTIARFGAKLQTLDIASQVLRKLARRAA